MLAIGSPTVPPYCSGSHHRRRGAAGPRWLAIPRERVLSAAQRCQIGERSFAAPHRRALRRSAGSAVVLSIDEKSQVQALDRTQPGLPIKPGRCQSMTHDYKRHGTTTLFAALSVLDGTVVGRCMQRRRPIEFIRFLNAVERQVPAGKVIHTVLDNYATHKHPKVLAWLARHSRWTFQNERVIKKP